jgi:hypothetical protein
MPVQRQWHNAEIDIRCKAAIETHFRFGIAPARCQRRKIQTIVTERLLQFEDVLLGEEDPGEMGLDAVDPHRRPAIGCRRAEERDLAIDVHLRDSRITELGRLATAEPKKAAVFDRLAALKRERIKIAAVLANRRIESAKQVVDLCRWFTGSGVLANF